MIRTVSDRISVGRKGGLSVETRPSRYARNVAGNRRWCADIRSRFLYEQLVEAEGSANQDQRDENESGPTPGLADRTQRGLAERGGAAGHFIGAQGSIGCADWFFFAAGRFGRFSGGRRLLQPLLEFQILHEALQIEQQIFDDLITLFPIFAESLGNNAR